MTGITVALGVLLFLACDAVYVCMSEIHKLEARIDELEDELAGRSFT